MIDFDFKEKMEREEAARRQKQQKLRKIYYIVGFIAAFIILFAVTIIKSGDSFESWFGRVPFLGRFFAAADHQLIGESDDRINILLLGMGGDGHDGPYLTDTIILASIKPSTKQVVLFSIPRDLVGPWSGANWQKVNAINANAESRKEDGGAATAQALSETFEVPIQYYFRVDFAGFVNIINEIGGVKIDVANTLDDYAYPILGQEDNPNYYARYEHLHFDKGLQTMDGDLALKYARSRHGLGAEGSDFARSKRQEKVIAAVRDSLLNKENLLRPGMIARVIAQLAQHISTNLSISDGLSLWKIVKDVPRENIVSKNFDDSPTGFLVDSRGVDGAFILIPKTGNFGEIKSFIQNIFTSTAGVGTTTASGVTTASGASVPSNLLPNSKLNDVSLKAASTTRVQIKNGTNTNGLAATVANKLRQANFVITTVGNSTQKNIAQTTIYDLTYGADEADLETLKEKTNAVTDTTLPDWLVQEIKDDLKNNPNQTRPDFILVLGNSSL